MKRPLLVSLAGLLLGGAGAVWWFVWRDEGVTLPDEKKAAMELLEMTQTGPGYFHPADPATVPDEHGILWINPVEAAGQIDRVVRERKLDEPAKDKLLKLIKVTSEPHPSRVIGGQRINLARLNVALDALP